jgi:exopolysaccharide production protein ExoZ
MTGRFETIQYARGIAASAVVVAHAFAHPLPEAPIWTWALGRYGVTQFFVISGFVMVLTLGQGPFQPAHFAMRRAARIVPLYWFITLLTACAAIVVPGVFRNTIFDIPHILGSLLFVPMYRPGNPDMIEPFVKLGWTLNYEVFFYAALTALFWMSARSRLIFLLVGFCSLILLGIINEFSNAQIKFYTGYDLLGFPSGMVLAHTFGAIRPTRLNRFRAYCIAGLIGFACLLQVQALEDKAPDYLLQTFLVLLAVSLLACGLMTERAGRLPGWRLLNELGEASFSIYLFHIFFVGAVAVLSYKLVGGVPAGQDLLLTGLTGVIGGLLLGIAVNRAVERPLTRAAMRAVKLAISRPAPGESSLRQEAQ